jgi:hypothetical protein
LRDARLCRASRTKIAAKALVEGKNCVCRKQ